MYISCIYSTVQTNTTSYLIYDIFTNVAIANSMRKNININDIIKSHIINKKQIYNRIDRNKLRDFG